MHAQALQGLHVSACQGNTDPGGAEKGDQTRDDTSKPQTHVQRRICSLTIVHGQVVGTPLLHLFTLMLTESVMHFFCSGTALESKTLRKARQGPINIATLFSNKTQR